MPQNTNDSKDQQNNMQLTISNQDNNDSTTRFIHEVGIGIINMDTLITEDGYEDDVNLPLLFNHMI
jgi:hypothetical protein